MSASGVRYAVRVLTRTPGFSAAAVLTLAIGIAADTAVFSVAHAVLLQPLPYTDPGRLVLISGLTQGQATTRNPLSYPRLRQIQTAARSYESIAGYASEAFNLTGRGDPEQVTGARVSASFFSVLGVSPAIGRTFTDREGSPGGDPDVVLSDTLWKRLFAADRGALGQPIVLDGHPYTVVGVLPPTFTFEALPPPIDVYVPRIYELNALQPAQIEAGAGYLEIVARLAPGVTLAQANSEMQTLAAQYHAARPGSPDAGPGQTVRAGNLRDETVAGIRPIILIFSAAVSLVLLIACANVAGLMLSRALGRSKEVAIRSALGAGRATLIRQFLLESLLLALTGGAVGALLAAWGTHAIASLAGASLPRAAEIHTNGYVLAFALLVSIGAGVLFGLAPALQITRPNLNAMLRSEARGSTGGKRRNVLRSALIVVQVAVSLLLLTGAGLLLRNFVQLRNLRLGVETRRILTMNIALPRPHYGRAAETEFFRDLVARVRALPGVRDAGVTSSLPLNTVRISPALPEGEPAVPLAQRPFFNITTISPGELRTMGAVLLGGREFTERDAAGAPLTAIVNQTLARTHWPGQNAIGKHILIGRMTAPVEVVGVVADIRNRGLAADPNGEIFMPFAQLPWPFMNLVVRTTGDPRAFVHAVREQVSAIDRDQPVTAIQTMDEVLDGVARQPRFATALLAALASAALLLSIVGIYGSIARAVSERTHEIGIRIALGAHRADVLALVLRHALLLALAGIGIGLAAALVLTRYLSSLLYHVSATDPAIFAAVALLFALVALAAAWLPARRAAKVDPIIALR